MSKKNILAISHSDTQGRIRRVNPNFCQLHGVRTDEVLGMTYRAVNHPDMPSVVFKKMWQQIRDGKEAEVVIMNITKKGKECWLKTRIEPKKHQHNNVIYGYVSYQMHLSNNAIKSLRPFYYELMGIQQNVNFKASEEYFENYFTINQTTYQRMIFEAEKTKPKSFSVIERIKNIFL